MEKFSRREAVMACGAFGVLGISALSGCAVDQKLLNPLSSRRGDGAAVATTGAGAGMDAAEQEAMQRFAKKFPKAFLKGDYVDHTQFPKVWAIRNKDKTLPRYFSDEIDWVINTPEPMGYMTTDPKHSKARFDAQRKVLADQIDLAPWTLIKGKTRPVLVVYSAWDCPYSRRMEADLRREGISYYLIPNGLTEKSKALAQRIYATPEFEKNWSQLLTQGSFSGSAGVQARPYPEDAATDIAFVFKTVTGVPAPAPATPLFVFKDGRSGEGWSSASMLPLIRKANSYF